ncbi:MAG: ATP phosphoribosyltransferase regulatory subunit [Clostridia bacterium]|nr:ATP phosphoribosyltransferase regulatory subunit [Clostridia bacterium]
MNIDSNYPSPSGIRDWLPDKASLKRKIESIVISEFKKWGYREVIPGTLEYEEYILRGLGEEEKKQLFRFFGRDGLVHVLRPDMTTPIARMAAAQLTNELLPVRLFYSGNVFRYEKIQAGRYREFHQTGVELIGADTTYADAEILILAGQIMEAIGVKDFKIGIGQIQLMNLILKSYGLSARDSLELRNAIALKDYVSADGILKRCGIIGVKSELLKSLSPIYTMKDFERIFNQLRVEESGETTARLQEVFLILKEAGLKNKVFIDLGITRDFDYYTGMVFEIYSRSLGFPICGGGRYNNLLENFGFKCPAIGFALGLERIMLCLKDMGNALTNEKNKYLLGGDSFQRLLKEAAKLRASGYEVEIDVANRSLSELRDYAKKRNFQLVEIADGGVET